ncbi:MAG: hypothetical protein A07HR60_02412 [uncultured archaeon A07HR60]|nr:MAG: hypothetical protein A07HR60_02412 [uncultured archaeon A07HR60]
MMILVTLTRLLFQNTRMKDRFESLTAADRPNLKLGRNDPAEGYGEPSQRDRSEQ